MNVRNYMRKLKYKSTFALSLISFFQYLQFKDNAQRTSEIFNCGAPRSGSTLLNIIIKKVLLIAIEKEDNFIFSMKDYNLKTLNTFPKILIKVHHFLPMVINKVKKQKAIGFFTHRDIGDIIVSLSQKGWISSFDDFINSYQLHRIVYTSLLYAKSKNMVVISYSDLMNKKEEVIEKVARALNIPLTRDEIKQVLNEINNGNVPKNFNTSNEMSKFDLGSGLHEGHINDGKSGKWKTHLTNDQIQTINRISNEYLKHFQYID